MSNHNSDEQFQLDLAGDSSDDNDINASGIPHGLVCQNPACGGRSFQFLDDARLSCRVCHTEVENLALNAQMDDFNPQMAGRFPAARQVVAHHTGRTVRNKLQS